jgi:hypothetical protein
MSFLLGSDQRANMVLGETVCHQSFGPSLPQRWTSTEAGG